MIIALTGFLLPYAILILAPYFASIPKELEESARIDGCSRFTAFLRITLPLSTPGLASCGAIVFIISWNELLIPLILNNRAEFMTLPVVVASLVGDVHVFFNLMMAICFVAMLPSVILVLLLAEVRGTGPCDRGGEGLIGDVRFRQGAARPRARVQGRPFGEHSPDLQYLLHLMRKPRSEPFHVLLIDQAGERWTLAVMEPGGKAPPRPTNIVFTDLAEAEWHVFKLRWASSPARSCRSTDLASGRHGIRAMTRVMGYSDRWSVAPGETVQFMVSCIGAEHLRGPDRPPAPARRRPAGYTLRARAGERRRATARMTGREQTIPIGSLAVVPGPRRMDGPRELHRRLLRLADHAHQGPPGASLAPGARRPRPALGSRSIHREPSSASRCRAGCRGDLTRTRRR